MSTASGGSMWGKANRVDNSLTQQGEGNGMRDEVHVSKQTWEAALYRIQGDQNRAEAPTGASSIPTEQMSKPVQLQYEEAADAAAT
ncbi:MAG: hypothetical protein FRX49_07681 [Trebouxia sp. A1-2]|nr:MAG: hypothetical protein FRX49_13026 [Trebouxia sp. A1-2]KAA6422506.1 MAG: hypothetical protein FRX49_07681 [Trebouxia sp. A1-2]